MATRGTGKTLQQILDEVSADNNASAQRQIDAQRKITEQSIQKNDAVVDKATAATTAQYQKQIDEAPTVYRGQYDANALAEAVNRRKLQESMANLGLTDSGLNRTQQTALSVMKGNADAATRRQQQEYVDGLQSAIDQVYAKGEAEKAAFANTKNTTQSKWESDLWLEVEKANREQANKRYAIQEQTLDEKYAADLAAERAAEERRIDYNKWLIENDLVEDKDGNPVRREDLVQEVPVETAATGFLDSSTTIDWDVSSVGTFLSGPEGDGKAVYNKVIRDGLKKQKGWNALDAATQKMAIAQAVGRSVGTTWKENNKTLSQLAAESLEQMGIIQKKLYSPSPNEKRIMAALEAAGYRKTDKEWNAIYEVAKKAYDSIR